MGRYQKRAGFGQFPEQTGTHADSFLRIVFEAVLPVRVLEPDGEYGITSEHQSFIARRQADYAMSWRMAASAADYHPGRNLVLVLKDAQLAWRRAASITCVSTVPFLLILSVLATHGVSMSAGMPARLVAFATQVPSQCPSSIFATGSQAGHRYRLTWITCQPKLQTSPATQAGCTRPRVSRS